jgi:hypothetical protein
VTVEGIPSTGMARTLADLGSVCNVSVVERALDSARRRGISITWLRSTAERLHRPGQSGTGVLLRLLDQADGSPLRDSWFEKLIEDSSLPPFERQYELRDGAGDLVARFDFAVPSAQLGIECHSRRFHFGSLPEGADEDRDHRVGGCGWDTLYLGYQRTRRPAATRDLVQRIVVSRLALLAEGA